MMEKNKKYLFLGVSTKNSSVNKTFPYWMKEIDSNAALYGMDLSLNSPRKSYLEFIEMATCPDVVGALITSHKTDVFRHGQSFFSDISQDATELKEISSIRHNTSTGELFAHNTDIVGSRRALAELTTKNERWLNGDGNITILGAGGACLSLLKALERYQNFSGKIFLTEKSLDRISEIKDILDRLNLNIIIEPSENTEDVIRSSGAAPLVINATGVGKDIQGSPISNIDCIGREATVWELNYRGDLTLLNDLRETISSNNLIIQDGWDFFVDGWMNNICFGLSIPISDDLSIKFQKAAERYKPNTWK